MVVEGLAPLGASLDPRNCLFEPGDTPPRNLRTPRLRSRARRRDPSAQSGTATAFSGELLGRDRTRDNATQVPCQDVGGVVLQQAADSSGPAAGSRGGHHFLTLRWTQV